jgi:hypothetical protein
VPALSRHAAVPPHASGARKPVEDVRGQHLDHAVQDERHENELIHGADDGQREIQRLDGEQCQARQPRQQPSGAVLVPEGEPQQAQVLAGDDAPQCNDAFHGDPPWVGFRAPYMGRPGVNTMENEQAA